MWARIDDDTIVEITTTDPTNRFHPSIKWVACSTEARPGWQFDGEQCMPPPPEPIASVSDRKRLEIDAARDAAFAAGLEYDFKGETDVVQTRPQDQINLLGLRAKAEAAIDQGITDPVMKFRGEQNITRYLTPDEMYAMTNDALAHIEGIYDHSWERKDAIDAALEEEDRQGIEVVGW